MRVLPVRQQQDRLDAALVDQHIRNCLVFDLEHLVDSRVLAELRSVPRDIIQSLTEVHDDDFRLESFVPDVLGDELMKQALVVVVLADKCGHEGADALLDGQGVFVVSDAHLHADGAFGLVLELVLIVVLVDVSH